MRIGERSFPLWPFGLEVSIMVLLTHLTSASSFLFFGDMELRGGSKTNRQPVLGFVRKTSNVLTFFVPVGNGFVIFACSSCAGNVP